MIVTEKQLFGVGVKQSLDDLAWDINMNCFPWRAAVVQVLGVGPAVELYKVEPKPEPEVE